MQLFGRLDIQAGGLGNCAPDRLGKMLAQVIWLDVSQRTKLQTDRGHAPCTVSACERFDLVEQAPQQRPFMHRSVSLFNRFEQGSFWHRGDVQFFYELLHQYRHCSQHARTQARLGIGPLDFDSKSNQMRRRDAEGLSDAESLCRPQVMSRARPQVCESSVRPGEAVNRAWPVHSSYGIHQDKGAASIKHIENTLAALDHVHLDIPAQILPLPQSSHNFPGHRIIAIRAANANHANGTRPVHRPSTFNLRK
jgi:hypothetical protein